MAGNETTADKLSSYIWKKHKILHFKQAQTGQNSRPDPRRDSCIYVVTDTSGSSECTLNNNTWEAGELSHSTACYYYFKTFTV